MKWLLAVLATACGCGVFPDETSGPTLICHAVECPPTSEVVRALEDYAEFVTNVTNEDDAILDGFEPYAVLKIYWYPSDTIFYRDIENNTVAKGYTESPHEIYVRSFQTMLHESTHAHFWRETGDPDHNHAVEPGPWPVGVSDVVKLVGEPLDESTENDS